MKIKSFHLTNFYDKYILPKVVHWACRQKSSQKQRSKIIPLAKGHVIEIAIGSGLNLPYYRTEYIQSLTGLEPSNEIWQLNKVQTDRLDFNFKFINAFAEDIPVKSNTFDTAVITYALCTIKDPHKALSEIKRVLKPDGILLFCEHGLAPDKNIKNLQNKINPYWKIMAGGCHLNKDIPKLITDNGFKIIALDKMYIPGWKPASYNYRGIAELA